jgi:hypothetical protein
MFLAVNLSPPGDGPMEGLRVVSVFSLMVATSKAVRAGGDCPNVPGRRIVVRMGRIAVARILGRGVACGVIGNDDE